MLLRHAPGWVSLRAQGASGPVDPNTPGFGYAFIEFANIEVECVECGRKSSESHENWADLIRVARRQRRPWMVGDLGAPSDPDFDRTLSSYSVSFQFRVYFRQLSSSESVCGKQICNMCISDGTFEYFCYTWDGLKVQTADLPLSTKGQRSGGRVRAQKSLGMNASNQYGMQHNMIRLWHWWHCIMNESMFVQVHNVFIRNQMLFYAHLGPTGEALEESMLHLSWAVCVHQNIVGKRVPSCSLHSEVLLWR